MISPHDVIPEFHDFIRATLSDLGHDTLALEHWKSALCLIKEAGYPSLEAWVHAASGNGTMARMREEHDEHVEHRR